MMRCASAEVPAVVFLTGHGDVPMAVEQMKRAPSIFCKTGIGKTATGGAGACADGFIGSGGAS